MREKNAEGVFWHWGRGIYRHRKVIVIAWLVLLLGFAYFAQKTPSMLNDNGFTPYGSESQQGLKRLQDRLGIAPTNIYLVYESRRLDLTMEASKQTILSSLGQVKQLPYVDAIQFSSAKRITGNKGIQAVSVSLKLDTDEALLKYPQLKEEIHPPKDMKVRVTGGAAVLSDMQNASKRDIAKAEAIGLPIALLVLLVVFGTVLAAILPLIVGIMSVSVTLGIVYFIAVHHSLSNFLPNMVTMLGLAVGIDYALFMVSRFREELAGQASVEEAVAMTCQKAGKSIFFSGIAVLIGLFGMMFIDLTIFRSLCLGGVLVVSISVIVADTLLLALLGWFGLNINKLHVIPFRWKSKRPSRFWERIAFAVMKRPVVLVTALGALLIYLMIPLSGIKLGVPNAEVLPPSYESRYSSDVLNKNFDKRELYPVTIAVQTPKSVWDPESVRQVDEFVRRVQQMNDVKEAKAYTNVVASESLEKRQQLLRQPEIQKRQEAAMLAKGRTAVLSVVPLSDPDHAKTDQLVRSLRSVSAGRLQTWVSGGPAYRVDIVDRINAKIPAVLLFVLGVTYFVLFIAFRSVVLPLKAVLMNVLSLGASLGVVVTVFQKGFLADALHITSIGYVNATLPVIIFCVVFGISMDYEVFLISRIVEEYEETGDNDRSTAQGLMKTGGLITSAAFILVVVVGSFIFTDIEIMKALGLGLGLAVLIDATIIRIIIVPAMMKLLGRLNWWAPKWANPIRAKAGRNDSSSSS